MNGWPLARLHPRTPTVRSPHVDCAHGCVTRLDALDSGKPIGYNSLERRGLSSCSYILAACSLHKGLHGRRKAGSGWTLARSRPQTHRELGRFCGLRSSSRTRRISGSLPKSFLCHRIRDDNRCEAQTCSLLARSTRPPSPCRKWQNGTGSS